MATSKTQLVINVTGAALGLVVVVEYGISPYWRPYFHPPRPALDKQRFSPFILASKEWTSSTSSIFELQPDQAHSKWPLVDVRTERRANWKEQWDKGIWSVEIKQPQLQIARAYTPLPPIPANEGDEDATEAVDDRLTPQPSEPEDEALRLFIRQEQRGEVSGWLHRLPLKDSKLEIRGPKLEFEISPSIKQVLFLAGGTGIAPAMQLAYALRGQADMAVLWANRRREECSGAKNDHILSQAQRISPFTSPPSTPESLKQSPALNQSKSMLQSLDVLGIFWSGKEDSTESPSTPGSTHMAAPQDQARSPQMLDVPEREATNPLVQQLDRLKKLYDSSAGARLRIDYFVDDEGSFIESGLVQSYLDRAKLQTAQASDLDQGDGQGDRKIIFVSGPDGFVDYWTGQVKYVNVGGGQIAKAPLGGVLGSMRLQGWEVIRL